MNAPNELTLPAMTAPLAGKSSARNRGRFLRWLRKTHGWLGLWGAVLGLLFGLSGFLLNHRAVMKIPAAQMEETEIQLPVMQPYPTDAEAFTRFVQQTLEISQPPRKRSPQRGEDGGRDAGFLGKTVKQPAVWRAEFQLPQASIRAEYIPGNHYATIRREDANAFAFISRMHKGVGVHPGWILLADTIAGAMMLLSITGVLLWTRMRGSRLAMAGLIGTSLIATVVFTWISL